MKQGWWKRKGEDFLDYSRNSDKAENHKNNIEIHTINVF